jgi:hypothetical protein
VLPWENRQQTQRRSHAEDLVLRSAAARAMRTEIDLADLSMQDEWHFNRNVVFCFLEIWDSFVRVIYY